MLFNINKSLDFAYDNKIYTESIRLTTLTIDSVLFITYRFELNRLNTITAVTIIETIYSKYSVVFLLLIAGCLI